MPCALTEESQASKKRRLDSPFPATTDSVTRVSNLPATTNSIPRPSVQSDASHSQGSASPSTTAADADPVSTRPVKSKADGEVLKCPITFSMYNNPLMLRKVRKDLSGFLRLVDNRLREIEASDDALDVWGAAMTQLDKRIE